MPPFDGVVDGEGGDEAALRRLGVTSRLGFEGAAAGEGSACGRALSD